MGAAAGVPAVEGWFTTDPPMLIGQRCSTCEALAFPPTAGTCPNPTCRGEELERVPLPRHGRVWSWATNHYAPPPPYVAPDPFEPYTVVAVALEGAELTVLGQLDPDVDPSTLRLDLPVEVTVGELFRDDDGPRTMFRFRPAREDEQ